MKASEIIGSNVLILETAKIIGCVGDLVFTDKYKKVSHLQVFIEDESDCEIKYISTQNIYSISDDTICVKYNSSLIVSLPNGVRSPLSRPAFDELGTSLGIVSDVFLDRFIVTALVCGERELPCKDILTYSDQLIVLRATGSKLKLTKKVAHVPTIVAKEQPPKPSQKVSILKVPSSLSTYEFLYGRTTTADICDRDGGVVLPCGLFVNKDVVAIARNCGIIARLVQYSV